MRAETGAAKPHRRPWRIRPEGTVAAFRAAPSPGDRDDVSRVKDACDIVRIIGEQVQIKPKGREIGRAHV